MITESIMNEWIKIRNNRRPTNIILHPEIWQSFCEEQEIMEAIRKNPMLAEFYRVKLLKKELIVRQRNHGKIYPLPE